MSEPDLEKQPLLTAGPVLSGSHANGLKQPAYDPNVRMALRRMESEEFLSRNTSYESQNPSIAHATTTQGCMLIHAAGSRSNTEFLEGAIGLPSSYATHQHCIKRAAQEATGAHGVDSWKVSPEMFASRIVQPETPHWKTLSREVQEYYVRQNAVIQSYLEVNRRFDGLQTNVTKEDVTESRRDALTTKLSNGVNIALTIGKVFVSAMSGSISIISSLVDSLVDLFTGLVLWIASHRIDNHNPYLYPIGRQPLEPLAVTICSVVMITASLQVIFESVRRLASSTLEVDLSAVSAGIMLATIALKLALYAYCKRVPTPISQALALDHMNDVVSNGGAILFAFLAQNYWLPIDPIGAILISVYIIYRWYHAGYDVAKGLSGHTAGVDFLKTITYIARNHHPDIVAVETVSAYHMGTKMICEVDIVLCPFTAIPFAHDVAETLQMKIESLDEVERCFVHIDFEIYHERSLEHMRHL